MLIWTINVQNHSWPCCTLTKLVLWHTGGEKDSDLSCIIGKYSFMFDTLPPTGIKISPVRFFTFHQFSVMVVLSLCIYQTFDMYNPVTYTQLIRWDQWKRVVQAQTWPQCVCVGHLMNLWRWFFAFFCLAGSILLWDRMIGIVTLTFQIALWGVSLSLP